MQVVVMKGIRIRAEADAEASAAGSVDRAQELAHPPVLAVPARSDGDAAPAGEDEAADIDRIGKTVLAQPGAGLGVDRAAGISAEALDPGDRRFEPALRSGLDVVADP